ncbi:hypothetical protein ABT160_24280 [Streptomyces sp. NPDC001941]|uniref:hypothetical protein n=1 Tax=Streptomyces sp. NPDC001941 TaxID=3154659 RepID=UPI003328D50B
MELAPHVVDGYVDAAPIPGPHGSARFQLVLSPTDGSTSTDMSLAPDQLAAVEEVLDCTAVEPRVAEVLLSAVQPGDLIRATGTLLYPQQPDGTVQLVITALELLAAAPVGEAYDLVLECYGPYVIAFSAEQDNVPVWQRDGTWVGQATSAETIGALIDAYENGSPR